MENNQTPEKEDAPREVQILDGKPVQEKKTDGRNVFIGTLNIFNAPVQKYLGEPLRQRYHRHYHPRHKHGRKHLLADIFLVLVVLGLLGANIYTAFFLAPRLRERVQLALATTPETVTSGDLVTLTFSYKNDNDVALTDAHLAVLLPKYFTRITTTPASFDERTHTFSLGNIAAGGNGIVSVSGQLIGSVGTDVTAGAVLSYGRDTRGVGERRESKGVSFAIPVRQSTVRLTLDFPEEVVHEGIAPFVLQYENTGKPPIGELVLQPKVNDTLQVRESSAPLTDGVFRIVNIAQGGRGEIRGQFSVRARGEETTTFSVQSFIAGTTLLQGEVKKTARVFYPKLSVRPVHDDTVALGHVAEFPFAYENGEGEDILDLSVTIDPPLALFDRDALTTLAMTRAQDPSLALVRAGVKGRLFFTLRTKGAIDRKTIFGTGDPVIPIPYIVRYRRASAPDRLIQFEKRDERTMQSDFSVDAFARYFTPEGDQLGRGPLPPRAGETTRYWVFIPVTNSISDMKDVVVTAHLGVNAEWTKKSSVTLGDPLIADERTRTITWRIPLVTKFSGGQYPDVGAAFEVALTPDVDEVGASPALLTSVAGEGRDTFTGLLLERSVSSVTTALDVDVRAKGKGRVSP